MYRSHNCGELRASHINTEVTLAGWVQRVKDLGAINWVVIRDRYGLTQLVFDEERTAKDLLEQSQKLGREFVLRITGLVRERSNKNPNRPTGDVEIEVKSMEVLNASKTPPFTIEDDSDGGDELRMK